MSVTLTPAAIEALYKSHGGMAFRRARALLGNDDDANDAVHQVFTALLERPAQFRGHSAPSTFLYSAVTHQCWTRLRDQRTRARLLSVHGAKSEATKDSAELATMLQQILGRMPYELAELGVYAYLDELTQQEIATVTGKSRSRIAELLDQFRRDARALLSTPTLNAESSNQEVSA